jgi:hypothetical protein
MVNFAMEFKYPRPPASLTEALKIGMCCAPAREFLPVTKNLIVDHLRSVVEQHLREANSEDARAAIQKLFDDLTKEKTNGPG